MNGFIASASATKIAKPMGLNPKHNQIARFTVRLGRTLM